MNHDLNGMSFFAKTKQDVPHSPRKLQLVNFLGFEYPPRYPNTNISNTKPLIVHDNLETSTQEQNLIYPNSVR